MRKPYSTRQRILGFSCAILLLIMLAACGKAAESSAASANTSGSVEPASHATDEPTAASDIPAETHENALPEPSEAPMPESPAVEFEFEPAYSEKGEGELFRDSASGELFYGASPSSPAYEAGEPAEMPIAPMDGDEPGPVPEPGPVYPEPDDAAPFVLTAGEWNDNTNWPFFVNLVNSGAISFPVFGVDPTNRIVVTVTDEAGTPLANETATLYNAEGEALWTAQTGKTGVAYLFCKAGQTPDHVTAAGAEAPLTVSVPDETGQGTAAVRQTEEVTLVGTATASPRTNLQVMFIVDTTGSMGDELIYLQKDFSSIAQEVGNSGISYSACFYRDEGDDYVTRCNEFTSDIAAVQAQINAEYAEGGGDTPEAVAQILNETLADNAGWTEDSVKIAFLIFDAPPHYGTDAELDRAIRAATERGIHVIPVVASNADRETELFGRALAICTDGTYVFLTDDSGVGGSHLEPIIGNFEVEKLHDVIVRIIDSYRVN